MMPQSPLYRVSNPFIRATVCLLPLFILGHTFSKYAYSLRGAAGISMLPTIYTYGEVLVVSKTHHHGRGIAVGDIVSAIHPYNRYSRVCKRVIGMPGDFVLRDTHGEGQEVMVQVPEGHCWLSGDNLLYSRDSRAYGAVPLALVVGKVVAKISPPLNLQSLENQLKSI